jgi:glucokinase
VTKSIAMIVAGEIGPSATRLALCGLDAGRPVIVVEETSPNSAFTALAPMVQKFLRKYRPPQVRAAAFVGGGPIQGGASLNEHLPWPVGAQVLASELGVDRVTVLSDVEGMAHALPALAHEDLSALNGGDPSENGNQAVIAVGDSAGVAGLYWNGTEHRCFASDGGTADFAPSNEEELRLALFLSAHVERVTLELLLSRAGVACIHAFVRGVDPAPKTGPEGEDPATAILRDGAAGADAASKRTLEIFLGICGSAAGNLALSLRAIGGVYLGGGIVPGLRVPLAGSVFKEAFCRKAPLQDLLRKIPVSAILNPNAALLGAATVAARELRTQRGSGWAS